DSPKTPPGSPPHQPPPPPPPTGSFGTSRYPGAFGSSQVSSPPPPPSINQEGQSHGSTTPSSSKTATSAKYTAWTITDTRLKPFVSSIPKDLHMDDDLAPDVQAHSFDDEDIENAHIPKVNLQQDWWKPLEEDRPVTPEPAWSILSSDLPYQMEECYKLLTDSVDESIIKHNVSKPLSLGGQPGQIKAAYYPDLGLEQMVPDQMWIQEDYKYDIAVIAVRIHMRILSVVRIEIFSMYGSDDNKGVSIEGLSITSIPKEGPSIARWSKEPILKELLEWYGYDTVKDYLPVAKKLIPKVIFKSPIPIKGCVLGLANLETWDNILTKFQMRTPKICVDKLKEKRKWHLLSSSSGNNLYWQWELILPVGTLNLAVGMPCIPLMNAGELPEMDPYEEVSQQGQAHPLLPAYVPDPMELDEHVPVDVLEPEHPEYHAPSDDDIQVEDDDDDPEEDPNKEHESKGSDETEPFKEDKIDVTPPPSRHQSSAAAAARAPRSQYDFVDTVEA
nr:hypothetical protein [Tanacetum cinerariifolium]